MAQQASHKTQPFWAPELEQKGYPFQLWLKDVTLWAGGTELPANLQGPAIAQRLGGTAKDLVRNVDVQILRDGRIDPQERKRQALRSYLMVYRLGMDSSTYKDLLRR